MEMDEGIGQISHQGHLQNISLIYTYQNIGYDTMEFLIKYRRTGHLCRLLFLNLIFFDNVSLPIKHKMA